MADTTTLPPKKESLKAILDPTFEMFKHLFGFDLNALISLADPEIREVAQKFADVTSNKLPKDHWLRTRPAERIIGFLSSRLESSAENQPKVVKDIVEKVSDFFDNFRSRFYGKLTEGSEKTSKQPDAAKSRPAILAIEALETQFISGEAEVMLATATSPEETEIAEKKIQDRLQSYSAMKKFITEGPPKKEPPKEEKGPWTKKVAKGWNNFWWWTASGWKKSTESLRPMNRSLEDWVAEKKEKNRQLKESLKTSPPDRLGELLKSPWKIIFGFGWFYWSIIVGAIALCVINSKPFAVAWGLTGSRIAILVFTGIAILGLLLNFLLSEKSKKKPVATNGGGGRRPSQQPKQLTSEGVIEI